jgi:hypothetical protein
MIGQDSLPNGKEVFTDHHVCPQQSHTWCAPPTPASCPSHSSTSPSPRVTAQPPCTNPITSAGTPGCDAHNLTATPPQPSTLQYIDNDNTQVCLVVMPLLPRRGITRVGNRKAQCAHIWLPGASRSCGSRNLSQRACAGDDPRRPRIWSVTPTAYGAGASVVATLTAGAGPQPNLSTHAETLLPDAWQLKADMTRVVAPFRRHPSPCLHSADTHLAVTTWQTGR